MAEKTREVEVKLRAVSETSGFARFNEHLEEMVHANRRAAKLMKETAEFAGGAIAFEAIEHAIDSVAEGMNRYREALLHSHESQTEMALDIAQGIPLLGGYIAAISNAVDAYHDLRAAQLQAAGASDEEVDAMKSNKTYWKEHREEIELTRQTTAALTSAWNQYDAAVLSMSGKNPVDAQLFAAAAKYYDERKKLEEQIKDFEDKNPHPTQKQRGAMNQLQLALGKLDQAQLQEQANIRTKARLAEQDFERDQNHQELTQQQAHDRKMIDLAAQTHADRIRLFHESYAAEAYLRKQALDAQLRDSKQAEDEAQRQLQELARKRTREGHAMPDAEMARREAEIVQRANEERAAMQARADQAEVLAKQEFQNQQKDAERQAQSELFKSQTELLQARGAMGDREAEKGAERLKLLLSERQQIDAIDKALRERNDLTGVQIEAMQAQQDAIRQTTEVQLKQLELQQIMGDPLRMYASASWSGAGAGMIGKEGARAEAEKSRGHEIQNLVRGVESNGQTTNQLLTKLLAAVQQSKGMVPHQIAGI